MDDAELEVGPVRRAALIKELKRALRLVYGDRWEEVYEDLILNWDPEEEF